MAKSIVKDIKFEGLDDWSRPVFKIVGMNVRLGSTITLYSGTTSTEEITDYFNKHINELEIFGTNFNCEPLGGKVGSNITLNIIE